MLFCSTFIKEEKKIQTSFKKFKEKIRFCSHIDEKPSPMELHTKKNYLIRQNSHNCESVWRRLGRSPLNNESIHQCNESNAVCRSAYSKASGRLRVTKKIRELWLIQSLYLADPGEPRGCSTNTSVID